MKKISDKELAGVNGGFYLHCSWCCGHGFNVDFYSELSAFLHCNGSKHKKYWNYGYGSSRGKCACYGGY